MNVKKGVKMGVKQFQFSTVEQWIEACSTERVELIEGEIVKRLNPSADHSYSAHRISASLAPFDDKLGGSGGPGGWWIYAEAHVVYPGRPNGFVHDLAGWRRDKHENRPRGKKIVERPDWVCEIISSNRSSDLVKKKRVLHEHRVPHYWTLDHRDELLTVYRWVEGGFLPIHEISLDENQTLELEPFIGKMFSIEKLFGRE